MTGRTRLRHHARRALWSQPVLYSTARRGSLVASFATKRPHEPEFRWLGGLTGPGVFLDIGANSGQSALSFRIFNRRVPIYSLEPNPACEPDLRFVRRLIRRFDYAMVAAGEDCGSVTLNIPEVRRLSASQAASLDADFIDRRRRQIERRTGGGDVTMSEVVVPVVPVDGLGLHVLAMKIDVEGTELAVLRGATQTIERQRPVVMLEVAGGSGDAVRFLQDKGYEIHTFDAVTGGLRTYDERASDLNAIALP